MSERHFSATQCWKKTAIGTEISLFSSASLEKLRDQRPILLMGGVHGDEPEGVALARATLEWLKSRAENGSPVACPWILIPCLNVDGYKKGTRVNGRGVDLNRNYPSRDWSPKHEKPRYYPGPSAASEPEIQGVVELITTCRPRLIVHCHSWEPCIIATGDRAQEDGRRLASSSGYELRGEIGYPTPGSLSRFGWHDNGLPVICIEERERLEDLSSIWPRFARGMDEIFNDASPRSTARPEEGRK